MNKPLTLSAIGYVVESDYSEFLKIIADPDGYPSSYADYQRQYQAVLQRAQAAGAPVLEVRLVPKELADWCASQGRSVNAMGRTAFGALKASELSVRRLPSST